MNPAELEIKLRNIQDRFRQDLDMLLQQGVLEKSDLQKIANQMEVSKNALIDSIRRRDLDLAIQEELVLALIENHRSSLQQIVDNAILRLGVRALIAYKFNQVDEKALQYVGQNNFSKPQIQLLQSYAMGARTYALKMLPAKNKGWTGPKINFQEIVNCYAETLEEYTNQLQSNPISKVQILARS